MEQGRRKGFLAELLLRTGDAIRFAPKTETLFAEPEKKEEKRRRFTPAFLDTAHRLRLKSTVAKAGEQSVLLSAGRRFITAALCARMRSCAILLLFAGLVSAFSYFARNAVTFFAGETEHLVTGITEIVLALWVAFDRMTFAKALKKSAIFRGVLQPLFGVEEWEIPDENVREHPFLAVFLGLALGVLQALFLPSKVLFWLLFAAAMLLTLHKPEAGLFLYASTLYAGRGALTAAVAAVTWFSFFCKVMVGKRSLRAGKTDLLLIPAVIWILVAGGGAADKITLILLVSLYALSCNLVRTLDQVRRLSLALSVSLGIGAFLSVARELLERLLPSGAWRQMPLPDLFDRGTMLLLAALCPVLLGTVRSAKKALPRILGLLTLAAVFAAFAFLHDPFLWIALLAGCWIFWILSSRPALLISLLAALAGGAVLPVLPRRALHAVTGVFGFTETTFSDLHKDLIRSAGRLSRALPWGTGLGSGAEPVTGLYFEVGVVFGVLGMIVFYLLLLSFFFAVAKFARTTTRREIHPLVLGAFCGVLTMLVAGFFMPVSSLSSASLFLLLACFPKIATLACRREEIRLPY